MLFENDWYYSLPNIHFDVIVVNDLFVNVDQRLEIFLGKALQLTSSLRILLTYYNNDRYYKVKRVDADEIFYVLAMSGREVTYVLERVFPDLEQSALQGLVEDRPSLFANGRLVSILQVEQFA